MTTAGAGDATMTSPAAVLDRMLDEVFVTADDWCQGVTARDAKGRQVATGSEMAVSRCVMGGIKTAARRELGFTVWYYDPRLFWEAVGGVCEVVGDVIGSAGALGWRIPTWNDSPHTTFEDVRLVLKQARENLS